jgi:tRNA-dihydrouridine synthase 1
MSKPTAGWAAWKALGSPRYVCAPMVWQSERAFRIVVRERGVNLAFTPMIHADVFLKTFTDPTSVPTADLYSHFANVCQDVVPPTAPVSVFHTSEEHNGVNDGMTELIIGGVGVHDDGLGVSPHAVIPRTVPASRHTDDRPLILQFCASDVDDFVAAARLAESELGEYIDGIDLNLGCPQRSAERGGFGVHLALRQPERVVAMVAAAVDVIRLPISAKIRVWDDVDYTVDFAKSLAAAGIAFLSVHGRTASQRHHDGRVRVETIAAIVKALPDLPIIGNGGITTREEADAMIAVTGCAAAMAAGSLLTNAHLFATTPTQPPNIFDECAVYMAAALTLPPPSPRFIRDHLMVHFGQNLRWEHPDLYSMLARQRMVRTHAQFVELLKHLQDRFVGDTPTPTHDRLTLRQIKYLDGVDPATRE